MECKPELFINSKVCRIISYIRNKDITEWDKLILCLLCGNVEYELKTCIKPQIYMMIIYSEGNETPVDVFFKQTALINNINSIEGESLLIRNMSNEGILASFELIHILSNERDQIFSENYISQLEKFGLNKIFER